MLWNIGGQAWGKTLGSMGDECIEGTWYLSVKQNDSLRGTFTDSAWKYIETIGKVGLQGPPPPPQKK
jgi:hypothetical protein